MGLLPRDTHELKCALKYMYRKCQKVCISGEGGGYVSASGRASRVETLHDLRDLVLACGGVELRE